MAELIYIRSGVKQRGEVCQFAVYAGITWGAFTLQPTVFPQSLTHVSAGSIGDAILVQEYGRISRGSDASGGSSSQLEAAIQLLDYWVRIDYTPPRTEVSDVTLITSPTEGQVVWETMSSTLQRYDGAAWNTATDIKRTYSWYGVVVEESNDYWGNQAGGDTGNVRYRAYTLESILKKKTIQSMHVYNGPANAPIVVSGESVAFNAARKDGRSTTEIQYANRTSFADSTSVNNQGRHVFEFANELGKAAGGGIAAEEWTALQMIDYLCFFYSPWGALPRFELHVDLATQAFLDSYRPKNVQIHGRPLLDVISQIIERRRGLTWYLEVEESTNDIKLVVRSYLSADLTLPSGSTVPQNPQQYFLDWSANEDGDSQIISLNNITKYSQVEVTGAPQGAVFSVGWRDLNLIEDWQFGVGSEKELYNTGYTPPPTDRNEWETANNTLRGSQRFRHIFTRFRFPPDWNGIAEWGSFQSGGPNVLLAPVFPNTGNSATAIPDADTGSGGATPNHEFWQPGLRVQNYLPLREGVDYESGATDENPDQSFVGLRKPFVTFEIQKNGNPYVIHGDRVHQFIGNDEDASEIDFSCSVAGQPEQLGVQCRPTGLPHTMGPSDESYYNQPPIPPPVGVTNFGPSQPPTNLVDYQTMTATVYVQCQTPVTMKHPDTPNPGYANTDPVLTIPLGDRAYLDWLLPGTIIDVGDDSRGDIPVSGYVRSNSATRTYWPLRDDRVAMRDLAELAFLWYGRDRSVISVSHQQVVGDYQVGTLIDSIATTAEGDNTVELGGDNVVELAGDNTVELGGASFDVDTMVTRVSHDFTSMRTRMNTEFAELDFASLF